MNRPVKCSLRAAVYGLMLAIAVPGIRDLAGAIEERWWPVRGEQAIDDVQRGPRSLCWRWTSEKLRPIALIGKCLQGCAGPAGADTAAQPRGPAARAVNSSDTLAVLPIRPERGAGSGYAAP